MNPMGMDIFSYGDLNTGLVMANNKKVELPDTTNWFIDREPTRGSCISVTNTLICFITSRRGSPLTAALQFNA